MQLFTRPEAAAAAYPFRKLGKPEDFLFLDIETTGLSPRNSRIWLIGAMTYSPEEGWILRQWLADSLSAEEEILRDFFRFAEGFRTLVHFNGNRFDLPFLMECSSHYGIGHPFLQMTSLDLYQAARPYKALLGGALNRRALELALGVGRLDDLSGKQAAELYEQYLLNPETAVLQRLLLHNEEDLTALPQLLSILSVKDFSEGSFQMRGLTEENGAVILSFESGSRLPVPFRTEAENGIILSGDGTVLTVSVPILHALLAHYFDNYKDYYYLPLEDTAIHKSVGMFVDPSSRVQATKETACIRKEGDFLPLPGPLDETVAVFRKDIKKGPDYAEKEALDLGEEERALTYLYQLLYKLKLREQPS